MTNVKAIMLALGRSKGTAQDVDDIFHLSLVKSGFHSVNLITSNLDWLTWLGGAYAYQGDLAPVLRRAYQIRFDLTLE